MKPLHWLFALQSPCCDRHDPIATPAMLLVASALMHEASVTSLTARMTYDQIAARARIHRATAIRAVSALNDAGWLMITRSNRGVYGRGVNTYVLMMPAAVDNHRSGAVDNGGGKSHGKLPQATNPRSGKLHEATSLRGELREGDTTGRAAVDNVLSALGDRMRL